MDIRMKVMGCSGEDTPVTVQQELIVNSGEALFYLATSDTSECQSLRFESVATGKRIPAQRILDAGLELCIMAEKRLHKHD